MNIHQEDLTAPPTSELNNNIISAGTFSTGKGEPGCQSDCGSPGDWNTMGDCLVDRLGTDLRKDPAGLLKHEEPSVLGGEATKLDMKVADDRTVGVKCLPLDPCLEGIACPEGHHRQPVGGQQVPTDETRSHQTAGGCYELQHNNRPGTLPLKDGQTEDDVLRNCTCDDGSPCFCSSPLSVSEHVLRWQRLTAGEQQQQCGTGGMDAANMIDGVDESVDVFEATCRPDVIEDGEDGEDVRQCKKYMEDLVDRIFNKSTSISQADNAKFGEYCQMDIGRQWFARLVDSQRVNSKKVTEQTFYRLVQFFAVCLFECNEADDFTPVKSLMNMCFTFYHEHEGYPRCDETMRKSFLYNNLTDQPIWKSLRFWNAAFFDAVHHERKQRSPENQVNWRHLSSEEREDTETLNENITFGQLATFLHNMMELGLQLEICQEFFDKMATIGNLSADQKELIQSNIQQYFHIDCDENTKNKRHNRLQIKMNFMKRRGHRQESF